MDQGELRRRTKQFALQVIQLVATLPQNTFGFVLGKQLLRSGTAIGANYREALRASSRKQFLYCIDTALREADETCYWLELLVESQSKSSKIAAEALQEAQQLVAILAATSRTTRKRMPGH